MDDSLLDVSVDTEDRRLDKIDNLIIVFTIITVLLAFFWLVPK